MFNFDFHFFYMKIKKKELLTDSVDLPHTMLNFDGDILTEALKEEESSWCWL